MRKSYLILSVIFVFCLFFGGKAAFAQKEERREFVTVEIQARKENLLHKAKVPVSKNPFTDDGKNFIEGEFYFAGMATVDCLDCDLSSEYVVLIYAVPLKESSVETNISVEFKNKGKCSIENKKVVLQRGKHEEVDLKCGIKIAAYYE